MQIKQMKSKCIEIGEKKSIPKIKYLTLHYYILMNPSKKITWITLV
jgi:hypothetical protein